MAGNSKSKRAPNFTPTQVAIIQDCYKSKKELLDAQLSATITPSQKAAAYEEIAQKVNAVSDYKRTGRDIQHKIQNMKMILKDKINEEKKHRKGTGGGEASVLLTPQERLLAEVFEGDPNFHGIDGGIQSGVGDGKAFAEKYQKVFASSDVESQQDKVQFTCASDGTSDVSLTTCSKLAAASSGSSSTSKLRRPCSVVKEVDGPTDSDIRRLTQNCLQKWSRNLDLEHEILQLKKSKLERHADGLSWAAY